MSSNPASASLRIVFAGTPDFALPALRAVYASDHDLVAVYTQPDRPAGRGRRLTASPVKTQAQEWGVPVFQPATLDGDAVKELQELAPDLIVVVTYGLILPDRVLSLPPLGCWNVHASLLPRWRGAAPIERSMLAGDDTTGVTIMQMDAGLDTGDMLLQSETPIGAQETAGDLHDRLAELGAAALMEALEQRAAGKLEPVAQEDARACYAARLTREETQLNWQETAEALARKVRAFSPRLVTRAELAGDDVRIWQAEPLSGVFSSPPGSIVAASRAGIDVACGEGALRIKRLQRAGKQPVSAAEYLNGRPQLRSR